MRKSRSDAELKAVLADLRGPKSAKKKKLRPIDWGQYRLNGGSYCMAVTENDRYCGRGEAWPGHNLQAEWPNHPFVPGCPTPNDGGTEHG